MEKNTYWTIAQKAIAAPSIVEIDKQPQLKPQNDLYFPPKSKWPFSQILFYYYCAYFYDTLKIKIFH